MTNPKIKLSIDKAFVWCLAWGGEREPQDPNFIKQFQEGVVFPILEAQGGASSVFQSFQKLSETFPQSQAKLESTLQACPELWTQRIGLVYGGATKIKQYVFESSKLPEVRGASALLDRINLVDLPAFFGAASRQEFRDCHENPTFCKKILDWLEDCYPSLAQALIPELIIYTSGGNILAMCPPAFTQDLAAAIEKRYISETITANACAVGENFKLAEFAWGLLPDSVSDTQWVEWYLKNYRHPLVEAYFGQASNRSGYLERFQQVKSFNELVRRLANLFNQRRSGFDKDVARLSNGQLRPSRAFPPMLETHPYLHRDLNNKRGGVSRVQLPEGPIYSDPLLRKRWMGAIAKRERVSEAWFKSSEFTPWEPGKIRSWVNRFTEFLETSPLKDQYYQGLSSEGVSEALNLREVGNASIPKGYVAYIYADGNNMGGYIQRKIRSAVDYRQFSEDVSQATEESVYVALAQHLHPHTLKHLEEESTQSRNGERVHPFEILTIGGDDVLLIVPASQALAIAKTLCEEFERRLLSLNPQYQHRLEKPFRHRYLETAPTSECLLSMSAGVLLTSDTTPIYYAEFLTNQLLKSAKHYAKSFADSYQGGTIDFLVLKGVNMISSNVKSFRENGLIKKVGKNTLKLYGSPYTLHEIDGLIKTVTALKKADFPRSQLYQIRSLLEQGKKTAILNYRYFRVRLNKAGQQQLQTFFENTWCKARENEGNLAPWIQKLKDKPIYETNWRELVDLYPFISESEERPAILPQASEALR
ncbi:type III-B CRISPR-associated protein Cas10/Cmr2 [Lyngbya confervoides]|uniref:Type III-B CRISPR-associated protein Cas10/Cmr2 n=1 Tax=Lyngbya confervoides BDU141951 TaxID=1574623 RepID=A0ABD4T5P8_9CYAN|nr:type III-B CRISPR-associated protein Cas10/Cmr2 [Lyngbya confervoides]MCM1983756.1 type III-B CRISPR-associated protein Cas10/Cmr2 [Lyngbya confervoides BDU141951]